MVFLNGFPISLIFYFFPAVSCSGCMWNYSIFLMKKKLDKPIVLCYRLVMIKLVKHTSIHSISSDCVSRLLTRAPSPASDQGRVVFQGSESANTDAPREDRFSRVSVRSCAAKRFDSLPSIMRMSVGWLKND